MKNEQIHKDLIQVLNEYLEGKRSQQFVLSFISELPNDTIINEEIGELSGIDFFQEQKMKAVFIKMLKKLQK
jgi:hypothetical protein